MNENQRKYREYFVSIGLERYQYPFTTKAVQSRASCGGGREWSV
jgi:hypothetical protein